MPSSTYGEQLRDCLQTNLSHIRQRIAAACQRTGRSTDDVTLVAVTKYADWKWVEALRELGVDQLGESRPQQLAERAGRISAPVRWHLIGHLQRNKVRPVLLSAALIHSADSRRLLERIDQLADELHVRPDVLLEVNVSGESAKDGWAIDDLRAGWTAIRALSHLQIHGLMTMAPAAADPETARPVFRRLRQLRDEWAHPECPLPELSMGMSNDFEVAIEEGATLIRIGSRLFDGCAAIENQA